MPPSRPQARPPHSPHRPHHPICACSHSHAAQGPRVPSSAAWKKTLTRSSTAASAAYSVTSTVAPSGAAATRQTGKAAAYTPASDLGICSTVHKVPYRCSSPQNWIWQHTDLGSVGTRLQAGPSILNRWAGAGTSRDTSSSRLLYSSVTSLEKCSNQYRDSVEKKNDSNRCLSYDTVRSRRSRHLYCKHQHGQHQTINDTRITHNEYDMPVVFGYVNDMLAGCAKPCRKDVSGAQSTRTSSRRT